MEHSLKSNYQETLANPWLVSFAAGTYFFFCIMQLSLFNLLVPFILRQLNITNFQLGALSSTYLYALALSLLPAGYLLDNFSNRKLVLITLSLSIVACAFIAISLNTFSIFTYRLFTGIANGFAFLAALRIVCLSFPKFPAAASGLMITFGMFGGSVASILFSNLFLHLGINVGLTINIGIGVLILILAFLFLNDFQHAKQRISSLSQLMSHFRIVAKVPQNWLCGIYTGLLNLSVYILAALWGNVFLTKTYQLSSINATSIVAMIFLGIIIGSPIWGWISDKIGSKRIPMFSGAALSLSIILLMVFIKSPSVDGLSILFLCLGFTTSAQVLSYPTIAESNQQSLISTATALAALVINFIGAFSQPLFGWILSGSLDNHTKNNLIISMIDNSKFALITFIIAFMLACLVVFFIKEPE